jgi:hypothetical protein
MLDGELDPNIAIRIFRREAQHDRFYLFRMPALSA